MAMDLDAIYARLTAIFQDVFDDETLVFSPDLTADDVDGWDSMAHIRLVLLVEKEFSVKFSAGEIGKLKNAGDLAALVQQKT